jgi:hypothetical protein
MQRFAVEAPGVEGDEGQHRQQDAHQQLAAQRPGGAGPLRRGWVRLQALGLEQIAQAAQRDQVHAGAASLRSR